MRCYHHQSYHKRKWYCRLRNEFPKGKIGDLVSILYTEIVTGIWVPARINTEPVKLCKQLIQNIILKFNKFKSSPYQTVSLKQPDNLNEFNTFLTQLCDLAPTNLKELLQKAYRLNTKWEDDWQFYLNMLEVKQVGCVAGRDIKLAGLEGDKSERQAKQEEYQNKTKVNDSNYNKTVTGAQFDGDLAILWVKGIKDPL